MPLLKDHRIFPELDITKTQELGIDPFTLTLLSDRRPMWKCSTNPDHTWQISVNSMTRRSYICPQCPRPTTGTYLSETALYAEVNHTLTETEGIDPLLLTTGSGKKIWWDCSKDDTHPAWKASVTNRSKGKGCPNCYAQCPMLSETPLYREVNKALTFADGIKAKDLSAGSNLKIWWNCSKDDTHPAWKAEVNGRRKGRGCPKCAGSKTESEFRALMNASDYTFVSGHINACWNKRETMQVDMLDETRKVIVEYDSVFAHGENLRHQRTAAMGLDMDTRKTLAALEAGYTIIRIRETPLPDILLDHPRFHQVPYPANSSKAEAVEQCLRFLN